MKSKNLIILILSLTILTISTTHLKNDASTSLTNDRNPDAPQITQAPIHPLALKDNKVGKPLKGPNEAENKMTQIFAEMFTDPMRKDIPCPFEKSDDEEESELVVGDGVIRAIPHKKTNYYEKIKMGWEASSYFFDFIDPALRDLVVAEFDRIFKEAQKLTPPNGFKEPYTVAGILGLNPANLPSEAEMINKLKSLWPTWNVDIWRTSITVGQVASIIEQWSWNFDTSHNNPAKKIVDHYDFDGDGRLNPREFLIAMIQNNKKVIDGPKKCRNCMEKIIESRIDPMFMYFDCASYNIITAEQIWTGLTKLIRPTKGFDIFKCSLESGKYRTAAINDFVLKAHKLVNGKVTKEEFRHGILLGFWDRQTDDTHVYMDDGKNLKSLRWGSNGEIDIMCEKILSTIKKSRH
jgi:hypothetical protein